jgi:hypothetical protein
VLWVGWNDIVHSAILQVGYFVAHPVGRVAEVVRWQIVEQPLAELDGMPVVLGDEMDVSRDRRVGIGGGELFERGGLAGGGLDDIGTADEHVGVPARHDDEVGERGRVGGTAGAGTGDDGDLRNDSGGEHIAEEDLAVAGECLDAFLDARSAGVVNADDGDAGLDGEVEEVADFLGVNGTDGAAANGEILGVGGNGAAIDVSGRADDAVAGHLAFFQSEVETRVVGVHAELDERSAIEEGGEPLAGRAQALLVAFPDAVDAAADERLLAALPESV